MGGAGVYQQGYGTYAPADQGPYAGYYVSSRFSVLVNESTFIANWRRIKEGLRRMRVRWPRHRWRVERRRLQEEMWRRSMPRIGQPMGTMLTIRNVSAPREGRCPQAQYRRSPSLAGVSIRSAGSADAGVMRRVVHRQSIARHDGLIGCDYLMHPRNRVICRVGDMCSLPLFLTIQFFRRELGRASSDETDHDESPHCSIHFIRCTCRRQGAAYTRDANAR